MPFRDKQHSVKNCQSNVYDVPKVETGVEPVTLAQAKAQCRVDFTDDDAQITLLIKAARRSIEAYCSISIVQKTITATVDLIRSLELPYGPVQSLAAAITLTDQDGSVVDPTTYKIIGTDFKTIKTGCFDYFNATISYIAGYVAVPEDLQLAILNEIAFRYDHRGDESDTRKSVNPGVCEAAQLLAEPYRRYAWL